MLAHDDPIELILDSLRDTLRNVSLIQLLGSRYDTFAFIMDTKLVREINSEYLNLVLSLKEARFLDVISPYFISFNKMISVHVVITGMKAR